MSLKPRLITRPRRHDGESRCNYLLRLAQRNYLPNLPKLAEAVGLPLHAMLSMTDEALAQFLRGVDLSNLAPPVNRSIDSLELVRRRLWSKSRICPHCLRQGNQIPAYFDLCLSLRCELHQVFLLDHCASCNQPLSYLRKHSFYCDCGQSLANLPTIKVDSAVDLFTSLLTPWRDSDNWFLNEENILKQEVRTAKELRAIINFIAEDTYSSTSNHPWIYLADWPIIRALLSPWPTSLPESVLASDSLIDSKRLGQLISVLDGSEHPFLLNLKRKLADYRKEIRRPVSGTSTPLVSLNEVRKLAKLDAAAAIQLFNSSYFTLTETRKGLKGPTFWVSSTDYEKINNWFSTTVSLRRAAEIIGCSPMTVRGLSRQGILQSEFLPVKPRSPRFARSNIDSLVKSIENLVVIDMAAAHHLVPLAQVAPAKTNCKRWCSKWPSLVSDILTGNVPIFRISNERGWAGIGVRWEDAKACAYIEDKVKNVFA